MAPRMYLPKDKEKIADAVHQMVEEGKMVQNIHAVKWWLVHHYLKGSRNFSSIDYLQGTVDVIYPNSQGLPFKYEEIVRRYQTEVGQLQRMDTRPKVSKRSASLNSMRNASVAQLVLDHLISQADADRLKNQFIKVLARYGTAALVVDRELSPNEPKDKPLHPSLEVVPPWELIPVPANPTTMDDVRAIIRTRWVPLEWLKDLGFKKMPEDKMEIRDGTFGETPESSMSPSDTGRIGAKSLFEGTEAHDLDSVKYARVNEVWIKGGQNRLARYVITSRGALLHDEDFSGQSDPPIIPIHVANYIDVGGFWGKSFCELVLHINVEVEALLKSLFQNIEEMDLFGYLMVPTDQGIDLNAFTPSEGPRIVPFEPSLSNESKVYNIGPANTGTLPGTVANLALSLFDRVAPSSEMLSGNAPGRADSGEAFETLFEYSTIPISVPAASIASAYATAYMALLDSVRGSWSAMDVAAAAMVDDALAGVVIDPATGQLDITKNPVPDPTLIDIGITSRETKSQDERRDELLLMLKTEIITPRWFRILSRKLNLNLPVAGDVEWQNYRRAMFNNIVLFGDGKTPGEIMVNMGDMHLLHLQVLDAFMARPEFQLADTKVREKFEEARMAHQEALGVFPDALNYPENEAALGGPAMPGPAGPGGPGGPGAMQGMGALP